MKSIKLHALWITKPEEFRNKKFDLPDVVLEFKHLFQCMQNESGNSWEPIPQGKPEQITLNNNFSRAYKSKDIG